MKRNKNNDVFYGLVKKTFQVFSNYLYFGLVVLCCCTLYLHASIKKKETKNELLQSLSRLNDEKAEALSQKQQLMLHLKSLRDPESIELIMMEKLGLVPSDQVKVVFQK